MRTCIRLLLGVAMATLGMIDAEGAADALLYTVTYVEVAPPSTAKGAALLRQYREATRKDEGTLRVEVLQRIDRPNQFVVLAIWKTQQAFETHVASTPAADLRGQLQSLLASPNDERLHTGLAVGSGSAASGAGTIYVVTHVDVIPPRKDDGLALLKQLAEDSRKDLGISGFDVLQQTNRPNHFTVVEIWKDRSAFDAHGMAPHARRFREGLAPMSGALYDERLYMALK
jgi:quinol monooxygenase YgiN